MPKRARSSDEGVAALSGIERERSVGIDSYASAPLPLHPTGLFQSRWIDFHVRELAEDGAALSLTDVPQQADALAPLAHRTLCSFVMCKENRTTSDALRQVAAAAGVPLSSLAVAGAKDKRAVTVQRVTGRGIDAPKLLRVNDKWTAAGSRVRVGHFAAAERSLGLDQARGNQFVVILRDLEVAPTCLEAHTQATAGGAAGEAGGDEPAAICGNSEGLDEEALRRACSAALSRVAAGGFVNYFGLQRFGSGEGVPTHAVGALLLRGAFRRGLQAILDPTSPGLSAAERAARAHYGATADAAAALRLLPRRGGQTLTQRLLSSYAARLSAASTAVADTAAAGSMVGGAATRPSAVAASAAHASAHHGAASAGALEASALEDAAAETTLWRLPFRERLLYVNALQSFAFNRAASYRIRMAGAPIGGDLVWAPSREIGAPSREIGAPSREVVSGRPLRPARRVSSTACLRVAPERRRPLVHRPDRRSRALRFGCPRAQSHCHVDGAVPSSTSSAADVLAAARRNRHGRRSRRRLGAQLGAQTRRSRRRLGAQLGAQTLRVAGKL